MVFCSDWSKQIAEADNLETLRQIAYDILAHGERQTRIADWHWNNDPRLSVCGISPKFKRRYGDFIDQLDAP